MKIFFWSNWLTKAQKKQEGTSVECQQPAWRQMYALHSEKVWTGWGRGVARGSLYGEAQVAQVWTCLGGGPCMVMGAGLELKEWERTWVRTLCGHPPPPVNRMTDTHGWKHYLSATTLVLGKNEYWHQTRMHSSRMCTTRLLTISNMIPCTLGVEGSVQTHL